MRRLTFATGPMHLDEDGEELRRRIALRLVSRLKRPVQVVAATSYAEVAQMFRDREADLAWLPPAVFVRLERDPGLHLLAKVHRSHGEGYRGALFVRADAPYQSPEDLAGKRVGWVDPDSVSGHLFIRFTLRERGVEPDTLFAEQVFCGSHGSVVHAVRAGQVDAGATHAQTLDGGRTLLVAGWQPYVGKDGMRPLLVTGPIPSDVVCAAKTIGVNQLDDLREGLLRLHDDDDDELMDEFFGGPRLVSASVASYDPVRIAMA